MIRNESLPDFQILVDYLNLIGIQNIKADDIINIIKHKKLSTSQMHIILINSAFAICIQNFQNFKFEFAPKFIDEESAYDLNQIEIKIHFINLILYREKSPLKIPINILKIFPELNLQDILLK